MFRQRSQTNVDKATFEQVVENYYESLYRFALSLTHREADACDLTQETFRLLATRGHQLRDLSKVKGWLFTTLHRRFLTKWRRENRFPHFELSIVRRELPATASVAEDRMDGATAREALQKLNELYRVPLVLFYLDEHSYAEIAEILKIPIGTVMSRIARGRAMLRRVLAGEILEPDVPEPLSAVPDREAKDVV